MVVAMHASFSTLRFYKLAIAQKNLDLSHHKLPTQVAGLVSQSRQSFHVVLRQKQSLKQFLVEQLAIQKVGMPSLGTIFK